MNGTFTDIDGATLPCEINDAGPASSIREIKLTGDAGWRRVPAELVTLDHEPCTIPCDGTGWTGNPRERCLTHYEL